MFNPKKTEVVLVILLILFISGFFLVQNPSYIAKLFLFEPKATQQGFALSITITGCEDEDVNATGAGLAGLITSCNSPVIPKIENIPANSNIKVKVYTNASTPSGFTAPATTIVTTVLRYITITLNTTQIGTANIYFNLTQAELGSIDPDDIRLYRYSTVWTELATIVINKTSDPASFYAETDSFSNFIIGEKAPGLPSITTPLASGGGISKGGVEVEKPEERPKPLPIVKLPEVVKKIVEAVAKIPEIVRYKVNYHYIYLTATFIMLFVILLEIIYYFKVHKR